MKIREAIYTDINQLAMVHIASWQNAYSGILPANYLSALSVGAETKKWRDRILHPELGQFHFVAENDEVGVVGFAIGSPERTEIPRNWGELRAVYVLTEHQKQGLGTILIQSVIERLKKQRLKGMITWTFTDNPARDFYRKMGGVSGKTKTDTFGQIKKELTAYEWIFS